MKLYTLLIAVLAGVAVLIITRSADVRAARAAASVGYEPAADEFWKRWETTRPSDAIRQAAPTAEYQRAWDRMAQAADDFQSRTGGKCLGHSEIVRRPLGERMAYVSFLALYDPVPLRVQMLYYRAQDKWTPISVRIDAAPSRWLQEANPLQAGGSTGSQATGADDFGSTDEQQSGEFGGAR